MNKMIPAILVLSAATLAAVVLIAIRVEGLYSDYRHIMRGELELTSAGKEARAEKNEMHALAEKAYLAEQLAGSRTNAAHEQTESAPRFPMTQ